MELTRKIENVPENKRLAGEELNTKLKDGQRCFGTKEVYPTTKSDTLNQWHLTQAGFTCGQILQEHI